MLSQYFHKRFPQDDFNFVRILLVVDEARNLNRNPGDLNRFLYFRRSLQCFPFYDRQTEIKFFTVLTDTTSRIANLAPPADVDPSGRLLSRRCLLFPPFTLMNTVDLWWQKARWLSLDAAFQVITRNDRDLLNHLKLKLQAGEDPLARDSYGRPKGAGFLNDYLSMAFMEQYIFCAFFGRPTYTAFLLESTETAASGLNQLLISKLRCSGPELNQKRKLEDFDDELVLSFEDFIVNKSGIVENTGVFDCSQAQALAVFGSVASIEVSAASRLATELSAGHMRWVQVVSKLRKYVYTMEISEPVLALAGHWEIMRRETYWTRIIEKYMTTQLNQSTMTGFLGEVAFQALMLMAWQKCLELSKVKFSVPFIPFFLYLQVFLGSKLSAVSEETAKALDSMREEMKFAWIRVNQVVVTNSDVSIDMLCDYAIRASVLRCKQGYPAIDFAAPVVFSQPPTLCGSSGPISNFSLAKDLLEKNSTDTREYKTDDIAYSIKTSLENQEKRNFFRASLVSHACFQVKDHQGFLTTSEKEKLLDRLDEKSDLLLQNSHLPSVFFCSEFDSKEDSEMDVNITDLDFPSTQQGSKRRSSALVVRRQVVKTSTSEHVRYVVFVHRQKPSDIDERLKVHNRAFTQLLNFTTDILKSRNIDQADVKFIELNARTSVQPNYRNANCWNR